MKTAMEPLIHEKFSDLILRKEIHGEQGFGSPEPCRKENTEPGGKAECPDPEGQPAAEEDLEKVAGCTIKQCLIGDTRIIES